MVDKAMPSFKGLLLYIIVREKIGDSIFLIPS